MSEDDGLLHEVQTVPEELGPGILDDADPLGVQHGADGADEERDEEVQVLHTHIPGRMAVSHIMHHALHGLLVVDVLYHRVQSRHDLVIQKV